MQKAPPKISIKDYSYDLPEHRIALAPLADRDASKMLCFRQGMIEDLHFHQLPEVLPAHSFIVLNETKVIHARLQFLRDTGALIEIFCLKPSEKYGDIAQALAQKGSVEWHCIVGNAKKWKNEAEILSLKISETNTFRAQKIEKTSDTFLVRFSWDDAAMSFAEALELAGSVPLPPYIKRALRASDEERYQTVFARLEGSVAAPTASLHLSKEILEKLKENQHHLAQICLHVGAGTFMPVKTDDVHLHQMHAEAIDISLDFLKNWLQSIRSTPRQNVVAVGTTACRSLESLYWIGVKILAGKAIAMGSEMLLQREAYELPQDYSTEEAITSLVDFLQKNNLKRIWGATSLIIVPGYQFRSIDVLITNFHQPQSTLLLLVAAFVGDSYKKIYQHAMDHDYRFLSYGDGSVLFRN